MSRANLALGNLDEAQEAVGELGAIADDIGTDPLRAIADLSAGLLAAATNDHEGARSRLEDSVDLFARSGAPFEMGQARIGAGYFARGARSPPRRRAGGKCALLTFHELGAQRQVARAEALRRHLQTPDRGAICGDTCTPTSLPRQKEILVLIAQASVTRR